MKGTCIIRKPLVEKALDMKTCIDIVESAFRLYGEGRVQMPPKVYLDFEAGDMRCMPVYIPPMNIAGVKNVTVHPNNRELPSVMATITLIDPKNGYPIALLDGTHITNMRTGAAGGVAAKYLSRQDSHSAAFVGAGAQAITQLLALRVVRPKLSTILAFDPNPESRKRFSEFVKGQGLNLKWADSVKEAVEKADIIVTTTPVRKPVVMSGFVREGTHINAIGADAPGKQELESSLLKKAKVVIDNWEQASHSGEINVPLSEGVISKKDIHADIGEVVCGRKAGRGNRNDITIFDSTGLAVQDISVAFEVYRRILSEPSLKNGAEWIEFF